MSWFDTTNLANIGNIASKAMKEAQNTLDKALDIEAEENRQTESKWSEWGKQLINSDSQSSLTPTDPSKLSDSAWGSFTGSFFESAEKAENSDTKKVPEPVASQPKKSRKSETNSETATSSGLPCDQSKAVISDQPVVGKPISSQSQSSLMEGCSEAEILEFSENCDIKTIEDGGDEQFSSSRLVVSCSPDQNEKEDKSMPSNTDPPFDSGGNLGGENKETCDIPVICSLGSSSSSPLSSIEVVSPSSIEILTPSSVELINSDASDDISPTNQNTVCLPDTTKEGVALVDEKCDSSNANKYDDSSEITKKVDIVQDDLNSSVSSVKTVIERFDEEKLSEETNFLESMLDEAMVENEKKSCDGSSQSSELTKLECPSETSCDEMDNYTSTSSDLEVIHSPSNSRLSGGARPPSSGSDDLSPPELPQHRNSAGSERNRELFKLVDAQKLELADLRKKNNDVCEVLQAREGQLLAVSREISQVQEESGQMSVRLEAALKEADDQREAAEANKEAAKRLKDGLAEQAKVHKDLEKQVERMKKELKQKHGDDDDKDEIIADLRAEGEALAKQNGKQAEAIRKLRAKDKTAETESAKVKAELENLKADHQLLSKSVSEKGEHEFSLNKLVKTLTEANQGWEVENKKMKHELEDSLEKVGGLRSSLETAYREMAEMKHQLSEAREEANTEALASQVAARKEAERLLEEERRITELERMELESRISNAQAALSLCERSASEREEVSRREVENIRLRLEASENRHEDLSESISQSSKPLLRQVESLQSALKESQANSERVELNLSERLKQTTASLSATQDRERLVAEHYRVAASKLATLESQEQQSVDTRRVFEERLAEADAAADRERAERDKEAANDKLSICKLRDQLKEIRRDREFLSASLESEKAEGETRRKKSLALMDQLKERDRRVRELQAEMDTRHSTLREDSVRSSPSPSLSLSVSGSDIFPRDGWPDEVFQYTNSSAATLYDAVKFGSSTAVVDGLQAQLKIKEGEVYQLQSQVHQAERLRESLSQELTNLADKAEMTEGLIAEVEGLKRSQQELEAKYQTMLTMYGEKVEEAEELRLDLQDVKDMFKTQIEQLVGKQSQ